MLNLAAKAGNSPQALTCDGGAALRPIGSRGREPATLHQSIIAAPAVAALRRPTDTAPVSEPTTVLLPDSAPCQAALAVLRTLRAHGHGAYLVGGCVRDMLLGRAPKDYDIATAARPKQVLRLFAEVVQVGVAFGVVRVRQLAADGQVYEIEVATFRADGHYSDGRRPDSVRFADARQDVLRRDFTINGLLADPCDDGIATVCDWVGGLDDLRARQLRCIGEPGERFGEDALRILRAPRFAARFRLQVEAGTAAAIAALAPTLAKVSAERITAEVAAMLTAPTAGHALGLLADLGLAPVLWPTLAAADPSLSLARVRIERALVELQTGPLFSDLPVAGLDLPLALALLAGSDAGWPERPEFAATLRLSRHDGQAVRHILELVRDVALPPPAQGPWPAAAARWLRDPLADAALVALHAGAPHGPWRVWRQLRAAWPSAAAFPDLGFGGNDLQAWGYAPGPAFRAALAAAEDVRLAGGSVAGAEAAARAVLDASRS